MSAMVHLDPLQVRRVLGTFASDEAPLLTLITVVDVEYPSAWDAYRAMRSCVVDARHQAFMTALHRVPLIGGV